jgi:uncharacterized protein YodC (DUF2158 family)
MANIKLGDVVILKSGGPQMTVTKMIGRDSAQCEWFDDRKPLHGICYTPEEIRSRDQRTGVEAAYRRRMAEEGRRR